MRFRISSLTCWGVAIVCLALAHDPARADRLKLYYTSDADTSGQKPPNEWRASDGDGAYLDTPGALPHMYWLAALNNEQAGLKKYVTVQIFEGPNNTGDFEKIQIGNFTGMRENPVGTVNGAQKGSKTDTFQSRKRKTLKYEFPSQPAWERLGLTIQAGGPNEIIVGMFSTCQKAQKKVNTPRRLQVDGGSFGATGTGAMNGSPHIRRIAWYPTQQTVDQSVSPSFSFPPSSGTWSTSFSGVDPEGVARPLGGVVFETAGPGLVPGQAWQLEFQLVSTAADVYDMYALEAAAGEQQAYVVDVSDPPSVPAGSPWGYVAVASLLMLMGGLALGRSRRRGESVP